MTSKYCVACSRPGTAYEYDPDIGVSYIWTVRDQRVSKVICGPLEVVSKAQHSDGYWLLRLAFTDSQGCRVEITIRQGDLAKPSQLVSRLTDLDLAIYEELSPRSSRVVDYLRTVSSARPEWLKILRVTSSIGWTDETFQTFVLPDQTISSNPKAAPIFEPNPQDESPAKLECRGDLRSWQESVAKPALHSVNVQVALCTGFAAPLIDPLAKDNFGVLFYGITKVGKTINLRAMVSIFGRPDKDGDLHGARATDSGIEIAAAKCKNVPFTIDDLDQAPAETVQNLAYLLGNGCGKIRADRSAESTRRLHTFGLTFGASAEHDFPTIVKAKLSRGVYGGESVRLIGLPAEASFRSTWDTLPTGCSSGREASKKIYQAVLAHYGHAGRAFLKNLIADIGHRGLKALRGEYEQVATELAAFAPSLDGPGAEHVRESFAIMAFAGELAIEYEILPWPIGQAKKATLECFRRWRETTATEESLLHNALEDMVQVADKRALVFMEESLLDLGSEKSISGNFGPLGPDATVVKIDGERALVIFDTAQFARRQKAISCAYSDKQLRDAAHACGALIASNDGARRLYKPQAAMPHFGMLQKTSYTVIVLPKLFLSDADDDESKKAASRVKNALQAFLGVNVRRKK